MGSFASDLNMGLLPLNGIHFVVIQSRASSLLASIQVALTELAAVFHPSTQLPTSS